jgi:uncharacterized protein (UPF0218 family)
MRFLLTLLLLIPSLAFAQPVAVIDAPSQVNVGDLVVINGGKSTGDNHLWVVDEKAKGRFLEIPAERRVVFASGTPGVYSFQLIVADKSAGISQAIHFVDVGGIGLPPAKPPIVSPPTPEPPKPQPPLPTNEVAEASRRGVIALGDPATATALKTALESIVRNPPTTIERQRSAVQDAIASALLARTGISREKDWLNEWRIPVNAAIDKVVTDENYISLIEQVIRGFDGTATQQPKPQPASITIYSRDNCKFCSDWKRDEMPRLKSQGWQIKEVADQSNAVPHFEICINGQCAKHQGYLTMAALKAIMEKANK